MNKSLTLHEDTDRHLITLILNENLSCMTSAQTAFTNFKTITSVSTTCKALNSICQNCCLEIFRMPLKNRFFEICKIQHILTAHKDLFARDMSIENPYNSISIESCKGNNLISADTQAAILKSRRDRWESWNRPFIIPVTDCQSLSKLARMSEQSEESREITQKVIRVLQLLSSIIEKKFNKEFNPNEGELGEIILNFCMKDFGDNLCPQYPLLRFIMPLFCYNKNMTLKILNELKIYHTAFCHILNKPESEESAIFDAIRQDPVLFPILDLNKPEEHEFIIFQKQIKDFPLIIPLIIVLLTFVTISQLHELLG